MNQSQTTSLFSSNQKVRVVYFCAEFALDDDLPIYSGGLGVLAGDVIRQASDDEMPMVGVGLFYNQGYFRQGVDERGRQQHIYKTTDPAKAGLSLVTDVNNRPVIVAIPHLSNTIYAQAWLKRQGSIDVYLLDTNIDLNSAENQRITDHLYTPNQETRIAQEILLGIGGVKLLRLLGINPEVYHLNEGHSAFAIYELSSEIADSRGWTFEQAVSSAKQRVVFTNHTVVAAGNDIFPKFKVSSHLHSYAEGADLPLEEMLAMGLDPEAENQFSMTILALNSSTKATTVSKIHNRVAKTVWPGYDFLPVTNGVHIPTWLHDNWSSVWPGKKNISLDSVSDEQLMEVHRQNKAGLLDLVKRETGVEMKMDGLTLVWARRFAAYKRPGLIFEDIDCLLRLSRQHNLQIIYAGKAHPKDDIGQEIFANIHLQIRKHNLEPSVVVLPNYHMNMASYLIAGADVWLNTPIRGQEASGTSGMKSGANGVLHLSTSDGWMDEVNWDGTGWILPDERTADAIFETIESEILPLYQKSLAGDNQEWLRRMRETMKISWEKFSSARMVDEYRRLLYSPIYSLPDDV